MKSTINIVLLGLLLLTTGAVIFEENYGPIPDYIEKNILYTKPKYELSTCYIPYPESTSSSFIIGTSKDSYITAEYNSEDPILWFIRVRKFKQLQAQEIVSIKCPKTFKISRGGVSKLLEISQHIAPIKTKINLEELVSNLKNTNKGDGRINYE